MVQQEWLVDHSRNLNDGATVPNFRMVQVETMKMAVETVATKTLFQEHKYRYKQCR